MPEIKSILEGANNRLTELNRENAALKAENAAMPL